MNTSYNWAYNGDVSGVLIHELTEGGMGRIGELGKNTDTGGHTLWSTMDLFRYNSAHQHDYSDGRDGQTTFFSIDGGAGLLVPAHYGSASESERARLFVSVAIFAGVAASVAGFLVIIPWLCHHGPCRIRAFRVPRSCYRSL